MGVGLSGNLADFGIADVFQLIGQQRKTGILELKSGSSRMQLVFDRGLIVSAAPAGARTGDPDPLTDRLVRCGLVTREQALEAMAACRASAQSLPRVVVERGWLDAQSADRIQDLLTRDTLFEVLRWQSGTFDFRAEEVRHERDPALLLGAEQVLMDGLRMVDEWQSFAELVPSESTVFQRVGRFETYLQTARRDGEEELAQTRRVFDLVDGRLAARRVIDLAQLGIFDGMRCLAELCGAGVIEPLRAKVTRRQRRGMRPGSERGVGLRNVVGSLLSLALLGGVVGWIALAEPAPSPPGFRIERPGLAALREAHAAQRVRHAIEAYRLEEGRWPESLASLERASALGTAALAGPERRSYYSRQREGGLIFLAPELLAPEQLLAPER